MAMYCTLTFMVFLVFELLTLVSLVILKFFVLLVIPWTLPVKIFIYEGYPACRVDRWVDEHNSLAAHAHYEHGANTINEFRKIYKFTVVDRLDPSALLTAEQNFINRFQTQVHFGPIGLPDWLILWTCMSFP